MSGILIKVAIGITGATTVAGGATAIYLINNNTKAVKQTNTDIKDSSTVDVLSAEKTSKKVTTLLAEKGLSILDSGNTSGWKKNWDKFIADHNGISPRDDWSFNNWEQIKLKTDDTSDLKSKCAENSEKEIPDEDSMLFKAVKKYCTSSPE